MGHQRSCRTAARNAARASGGRAALHRGTGETARLDILAARDLLAKASASDPRHALSHAALSECLWSLGLEREAKKEGENALSLSGNLGREEQLLVEARYRWSAHQ